jgi:hypothetical protein
MPYPFSKADVGDSPTRTIPDAEKNDIAAERNQSFEQDRLAEKRQGFKEAALSRIALAVPEWDTFEEVKLIASMWNMLGGTPTASQMLAKNIYVYAKTSIAKLNGLAAVDMLTVDPSADLPFSVADPTDTGWPT